MLRRRKEKFSKITLKSLIKGGGHNFFLCTYGRKRRDEVFFKIIHYLKGRGLII